MAKKKRTKKPAHNAIKAKWRPRFLVREAREAAGISQGELAARIGATQARISEWETGRKTPSWGNLHEIGTALGLDVLGRLVDMCSRFDTEYKHVPDVE